MDLTDSSYAEQGKTSKKSKSTDKPEPRTEHKSFFSKIGEAISKRFGRVQESSDTQTDKTKPE